MIKSATELPKETLNSDYLQNKNLEKTDLYLAYNHLFSKAAKKAIAFEKTAQLGIAVLTCLAVGEENIIKAAEEVVAAVNVLAKNGHITGFTDKLIAVKLFSEPYEENKWVVLSNPALTEQGYLFLKKTRWGVITEQGQTHSKFEIRT